MRFAVLAPKLGRALAGVFTCWVAVSYIRHVLTHFWAETIDDAAITYSYADNLAHGHGLRLTQGEAPVEGFSNFLQVLLLAPAAALNANLDVVSKSLNLAFVLVGFTLLSLLVLKHAKGSWVLLAPAPFWFALLWPTFNYWSFAGLEGGILAGLQVTALALLAWPNSSGLRPWLVGIACGLLAWCRPEAVVYGGVLATAAFFVLKPRLRAGVIFATMVVALIGFRWLYFHDVVPNTYWAKISPVSDPARGMNYVKDFVTQRWWYFVSPLPVLALANKRLLPVAIAGWLSVAWAFFFPIHSGGDWMLEFRFIQPALGLLVALSSLGVLAIAEQLATSGSVRGTFCRDVVVALGVSASILLLSLVPPGWEQRAISISKPRDLSYQRISGVAPPYRQFAHDLGLKRRLLHADVDVGGTSFRSGLDIIDLAGLTDRTLALGWTRHPTSLTDYLMLERRPDSVHLHGGWLGATPFQNLPLAPYLYRELADAQLGKMFLGPLTLLREDLIGGAAPPMMAKAFDAGGAVGYGVSTVAMDNGSVVVFVHCRAKDDLVFPNLAWSTSKGTSIPVVWDDGIFLKAPPRGTWLMGKAVVQPHDFPLSLSDSDVTLKAPVESKRDCSALSYWARAPLYRMAGLSGPCDCDPHEVLELSPGVARVRGVAFLAEVCERSWVAGKGAVWAAEADELAESAPTDIERYEMASAAAFLGETRTRKRADRVERLRSVAGGGLHSLETLAWVVLRTGEPSRTTITTAARLHYGARRFKYSLLWSWPDDEGVANESVFCDSTHALGLRRSALLNGQCATDPRPVTKPARANFEGHDDQLLFVRSSPSQWTAAGMREGQPPFIGGGGGKLLNTFGVDVDPHASIVWGPWRGPFSFFGLEGGSTGADYVVVEKRAQGQSWTALANVIIPANAQVLVPYVQGIRVEAEEEVRITIPKPSGTLLLDSLTLY
ncbi:MAG: hypothetical protein SF187_19175 [Deltaproteobacteria bacterium]|nr:hypothetical protein [Deltaproteobacteria bacterium]